MPNITYRLVDTEKNGIYALKWIPVFLCQPFIAGVKLVRNWAGFEFVCLFVLLWLLLSISQASNSSKDAQSLRRGCCARGVFLVFLLLDHFQLSLYPCASEGVSLHPLALPPAVKCDGCNSVQGIRVRTSSLFSWSSVNPRQPLHVWPAGWDFLNILVPPTYDSETLDFPRREFSAPSPEEGVFSASSPSVEGFSFTFLPARMGLCSWGFCFSCSGSQFPPPGMYHWHRLSNLLLSPPNVL